MPAPDSPDSDPDPAADHSSEPVTLHLVRQAQAGDESALASLYERHWERVRRVAAASLGQTLERCGAEIDDVAQDAFLEAISMLRQAQFECRSDDGFRHWLAKVVCNLVRARGRQAVRRRESPLSTLGTPSRPEPIAIGPGPSTTAGDREIQAAVLQMEERDRSVLTLRSVCGMPWREVAEAMGLTTERQAGHAYEQAIERLRRALGVHRNELEAYYRTI